MRRPRPKHLVLIVARELASNLATPVFIFDESGIIATGASSALLAAHPEAIVHDVRGCVVTPGMVNAHQHLTGDPLVRSCIPDLLAPGASIFPRV